LGCIAHKLSQKYSRTFYISHDKLLFD